MAGKSGTVTVKMNRAGVKQLLRSAEVLGMLEEKGDQVLRAAGGEPDFEMDSRIGATRARVSVRTASEDGRRAEAEDRVLSSALDAARG